MTTAPSFTEEAGVLTLCEASHNKDSATVSDPGIFDAATSEITSDLLSDAGTVSVESITAKNVTNERKPTATTEITAGMKDLFFIAHAPILLADIQLFIQASAGKSYIHE